MRPGLGVSSMVGVGVVDLALDPELAIALSAVPSAVPVVAGCFMLELRFLVLVATPSTASALTHERVGLSQHVHTSPGAEICVPHAPQRSLNGDGV